MLLRLSLLVAAGNVTYVSEIVTDITDYIEILGCNNILWYNGVSYL